jgi:hypothetical protein
MRVAPSLALPLALLAASALAEPVTLLELRTTGIIFEFTAHGPQPAQVRVPVAPGRDWQPTDTLEAPAVIDVALGSRRDTEMLGAIAAELVRASDGSPQALRVSVNLEGLTQQGTYDVLVQLCRTRASAEPLVVKAVSGPPSPAPRAPRECQSLPLKLVHPEARLGAVNKLQHTRVLDSFFFGWMCGLSVWLPGCAPPPPPDPAQAVIGDPNRELVLHELGGRSHLTRMRLVDSEGGEAPLAFTLPSETLEARGTLRVPYRVRGPDSISRVQGTLWVHAPQLAYPVDIDYEIHARRPYLDLMVVLGLGLAVGMGSRVFLKRKIALHRARLEAWPVRHRIAELRALPHHNATFLQALTRVEEELRAAEQHEEATRLQQAVTEANQRLDEALANLGKLRQELLERIQGLRKGVAAERSLPREVRQVLERYLTSLDALEASLQAGDLTESASKLEALARQLARDLKQPVALWRKQVIKLLLRLGGDGAPLPAPVMARLRDESEGLRRLARVSPHPEDAVHPDLQAVLDNVHEVRVGFLHLSEVLQGLLQEEITAIRRHLPRELPGRKTLGALFRKLSLRWREAAEENLESLLTGLDDDLVALETELGAAIRSGLDDGDTQGLELLRQRHFREAAQRVVRTTVALEGPPEKPEGEPAVATGSYVGVKMALPSSTPPEAMEEEPPPLQPPAHATPVAAAPPPEPRHPTWYEALWPFRRRETTRDERSRLKWHILASENVQTLVAGVVILAAQSPLLLNKFEGTPEDFISAFLWAFSTDITTEAALSVARSYKRA